MSTPSYSDLNFYICDGLVVTSDSILALFMGDSSEADPDTLSWADIVGDDYIGYGSSDSSMEFDESLENQDLYNSLCRAEYDDNAIAEEQAGFCCQSLYADFDGEDSDSPMAVLIKATSATVADAEEPVVVTITEGVDADVYFGAEVFASAKGLAVSFAAVASTALVFAQ